MGDISEGLLRWLSVGANSPVGHAPVARAGCWRIMHNRSNNANSSKDEPFGSIAIIPKISGDNRNFQLRRFYFESGPTLRQHVARRRIIIECVTILFIIQIFPFINSPKANSLQNNTVSECCYDVSEDVVNALLKFTQKHTEPLNSRML